jgi:hypothetical protein
MTAIELANQLDHESDLGECKHYEAAAMLRKQDAAIKQLRETLQSVKRMSYDGSAQGRVCDAALAATEEFQK